MSFEEVFATFGGVGNVWLENEQWVVLIRPKQVTLGSSVLMLKRSALTIADLLDEELLTFGAICRSMESKLKSAFAFDKINYLMLAMKDPHLHFHVIPRYATERQLFGVAWHDAGWPKPPNLETFLDTPYLVEQVRDLLRSA